LRFLKIKPQFSLTYLGDQQLIYKGYTQGLKTENQLGHVFHGDECCLAENIPWDMH